MSTSLNDAIFELRRELDKRNGLYVNKSRLQRLLENPSLIFRWLFRAWQYCSNKYARMYLNNRRKYLKLNSIPNEFNPVDKKFPDTRIAVYTVITDGYDNLKDPIYVDDSIDYYAITDVEIKSNVWKQIPLSNLLNNLNGVRVQRYIKLHPDKFLKNYDYSIYIDGSLRISCDIKPLVYSLVSSKKSIAMHIHCERDCIYEEAAACFYHGKARYEELKNQVEEYMRKGFPEHFGLFETPVIIRKCNDPELNEIMSTWWHEIEKNTHRDQLSFTYSLWKHGKDASYVFPLGSNVWKNPYFLVYPHNKSL